MDKILLELLKKKEVIYYEDPIFREVHRILENTSRLTAELNTGYKRPEEVREILSEIIGEELHRSIRVLTPFNIDFGGHVKLGKNVLINKSCIFSDLGGIDLEDDVLIGPGVKILSVNHILEPKKRKGVVVEGVKIKENAWIGAGATICPGVTIGENAVIGAGSVVTKDVPSNTVYAGVPAKFIKNIEEEIYEAIDE